MFGNNCWFFFFEIQLYTELMTKKGKTLRGIALAWELESLGKGERGGLSMDKKVRV